MLTKLFNHLKPILVDDDEMHNLRSTMLNFTSIVVIVYVLLLAIFQIITGAIPWLIFSLDLLLIPFMVLSRYWYSKRKLQWSALVIVISAFIINTAIIFNMGTIYAPATPAYLILIIFSGLFFGRRGVIFSVLFSSLLVLALMMVDLNTSLMPDMPSLSTNPFPTWITYTLVFIVSGWILQSTVVRLGLSMAAIRLETNERMALLEQQRLLIFAIDQSPYDTVITDADGNVTYANSKYLKDTGFTLQEIRRKNLRDSQIGFVPIDDNQDIWKTLNTALFYKGESTFSVLDDQTHFFNTTISTILDENGKKVGFISVSEDSTEQRTGQILQDTVFSIAAAAQSITRLEDFYPIIYQKLNEVLDARNFYVALYDKETDLINFVFMADELDDLIPEPFHPTTSITARVLKSGQTLRLTGEQLVNTEEVVLLGDTPMSWLGVPLLVDGISIGVMAVQHYTNVRAYTAADEKVMEYFSIYVANAIEKIRVAELLTESTMRLNQMANNIPEALWITSDKGNLQNTIYLNKSISKIFDVPYEQITKDPSIIMDRMLPQYRTEFERVLLLQENGLPTSFVFEYKYLDGSIHWISDKSFPVLDEFGNHIRTTGYSTDITEEMVYKEKLKTLNDELEMRVGRRTVELQRSRDELSATNSELEKASRLKNEFLASMSHELRTPLTGILGLSEALQYRTYGDLTEKQLYVVKNIELSGRHLLDLINDILDVSKLEAEKLDINLVDCIVSDLCNASLQMTKGMAHQKKITVDFTIDRSSMVIKADPKRVKQILVNLLSNAIKFTPVEGKVGLDVHGDELNNSISFSIWDNGIGIREEDHQKLFQPFIQLDASLSRQQAGTGLGLVLVAHLAELHGGSVSFESKLGEGSRFTVILPWNENVSLLRAEDNLRITLEDKIGLALNPEQTKGNILLIDDNEIIIQTITDFLMASGYKVMPFINGSDALAKAGEILPDVVITDIQMPGMDGLEVTRQLRSHHEHRLASVPIIALTALAMPGDDERCLAAGVNLYLSKPVSLVGLLTELEKLLVHL